MRGLRRIWAYGQEVRNVNSRRLLAKARAPTAFVVLGEIVVPYGLRRSRSYVVALWASPPGLLLRCTRLTHHRASEKPGAHWTNKSWKDSLGKVSRKPRVFRRTF